MMVINYAFIMSSSYYFDNKTHISFNFGSFVSD